MSATTPRQQVTYDPILRPIMPELDAVRGLAILLVLLYHGFSWSNGWDHLHGVARAFVIATDGGWTGVNLFFVLSGFLITGILLDSCTSRHYYRTFYIRRALRILPLYYAVLAILAVTGHASRGFLLISAFYISNLGWMFSVPMYYGLLWSLAVEEQFYLLWPALIRKVSLKAILAITAVIISLSPAVRALAFRVGPPYSGSSTTWLVADGLALGAFIAAFVRLPSFSRRRFAVLGISLITTAVLLVMFGFRHGIVTRKAALGSAFQLSIVNWMCAGFFVFVLLVGTGPYKRITFLPALRFLGRISYGLYLLHLFAFDAYDIAVSRWLPALTTRQSSMARMSLRFCIAVTLALLMAVFSRKFLEEPFLRMKSRLTSKPEELPKLEIRAASVS